MFQLRWKPTPLLKPHEFPVIDTNGTAPVMRFRGLYLCVHLLLLAARLLFLKLIRRLDAGTVGRHFGAFCLRMGILWIKVAQFLSMRVDLFPDALCSELARLQDRGSGFSPVVAKEIIAREVGGKLDKVFDKFEETPRAAASIAQVHKARLKREGVWVAVKIRRPGIDRVFIKDMAMIRRLFRILTRLAVLPFMRWRDMLWELEQVFTEELDYRYEIANQERLRKKLTRHQIYVPKVFHDYCTREILVMEFIEGVPMSDLIRIAETDPSRLRHWFAENRIDPSVVGRNLLFSFLRQVLEDNLFHTDLHPGNVFILRDNRVALLDFGSIGANEGDLLRKYDAYLEAMSTGQYAKAIDVFLLIPPELPTTNLAPVKEELLRRLHSWGSRCRVPELPYREKSAASVSDEMSRVLAKNGITLYWAFFKLLRGWTTLDASLRILLPRANLPQLMTVYSRNRRQRSFRQVAKQLPVDLLKLQNLIDYPRETSEKAVYRGAMIRRLAQVFESTTTRVSRLAATLFGLTSALCLVAVLHLVVVFLFQHAHLRFGTLSSFPMDELMAQFPSMDSRMWLVVLGFMCYLCFSLARLARRFRKED